MEGWGSGETHYRRRLSSTTLSTGTLRARTRILESAIVQDALEVIRAISLILLC